MANPAKNVSRSNAADAVPASVSKDTPCLDVVSKSQARQPVRSATSASSAKAAKKLVADQKRDERRRRAEAKKQDKAENLRQKEVKQNETDDRFTSPEFIRAIEDRFGKIDFDPCWHEMSAVTPKAYLDVRQGHNGLRDEWSGA